MESTRTYPSTIPNNDEPIPQYIKHTKKFYTSYKDSRKCQLYGYIPYPTPSNANRYEWHNAYTYHLSEMYNEIRRIINFYYPKNKIDWNNVVTFNMFSKLIFDSSSKYISQLLDKFNIENELKETNNDEKNKWTEI